MLLISALMRVSESVTVQGAVEAPAVMTLGKWNLWPQASLSKVMHMYPLSWPLKGEDLG